MRNKQTDEQRRMKKNAHAREYYKDNSLSIRKKRKKRYQKNREREKAYSKEYYAKHKKNKRNLV